jgi:anion-transporting  ArsA/GET3 family ATPase
LGERFDPARAPQYLTRVRATRLVIVTGKGGVGKTTIAAALARAAAAQGEHVLLVEVATPSRLGSILEGGALGPEPRPIADRVGAVALDEQRALEALVDRLMPLRLLSRRLLSSESFRTVAAAVPGILEAALLTQLGAWLEGKELGRAFRRCDRIVVDAPASGHTVPLLATPQTLGGIATMGPLGEALRRTSRWLRDRARTAIVVAAIPEDWAIAEAIELARSLRDDLGLPVARPVLNGVFPKRFSRDEERALRQAESQESIDVRLLRAGRYFAARREAAAEQTRRLRAATGERPLELPYLFSARMSWSDLEPIAAGLSPLLAG